MLLNLIKADKYQPFVFYVIDIGCGNKRQESIDSVFMDILSINMRK